MNIVADMAIPGLEETFAKHAKVERVDGRAISRETVEQADVLLVRTVTRVDERLLAGTFVRFVGSATIGTDHLDTEWLDAQGINWANAPGCNADAAAQYTLAMMLLACRRIGIDLTEQSVGIIGYGNVGSRVAKLLDALDIPWVANDPPLVERGETGLVPLETALAQPIVSLHVPLTRDGPHPTWRMIGMEQLAQMPDGGLLVNAARGDVLSGDDLLSELAVGRLFAALDTWPGEPDLDPKLVAAATVATPHVAGYSLQGKICATQMIYGDFLAWLGQHVIMRGMGTGVRQAPPARSLSKLVETVTGVARDDARLRATQNLVLEQRAAAFDQLRADYPARHEFASFEVYDPELKETAVKLGFHG